MRSRSGNKLLWYGRWRSLPCSGRASLIPTRVMCAVREGCANFARAAAVAHGARSTAVSAMSSSLVRSGQRPQWIHAALIEPYVRQTHA